MKGFNVLGFKKIVDVLFKKGSRGKVVINGQRFTGDHLIITGHNGNIQVSTDGGSYVEVSQGFGDISINVEGDVEVLKTTSGDVQAQSVGQVSTTSGDVKCSGDIQGNVSTTSGNVGAKEISGQVSTVSGNINRLL